MSLRVNKKQMDRLTKFGDDDEMKVYIPTLTSEVDAMSKRLIVCRVT